MNVETVAYKNVTFTVWDVGGRTKIRYLLSFVFFSFFLHFLTKIHEVPYGDTTTKILEFLFLWWIPTIEKD